MYARLFKRWIDFALSLVALILLFPILLLLAIIGAVVMRGNPFFCQARPGRIRKRDGRERIFKLVKFRTMNNRTNENGELLPDAERLGRYGRFLRSTSLDELPELWNILKGDMSIVGPRPLLVEYLPWYTEEERRRHLVRPGLTGWAQVNGRNSVCWDARFQFDVEYVSHITLLGDIKILFLTVKCVFARNNVAEDTRVTEGNFADMRRRLAEQSIENSETISE